jgi:hypothetical protein
MRYILVAHDVVFASIKFEKITSTTGSTGTNVYRFKWTADRKGFLSVIEHELESGDK